MNSSRQAALIAALLISVSPYGAMAQTNSPIEHVIIIVGENHTFDNVFGAYTPRPGQTVMNLLSQDIIDAEGNPGDNFALARQRTANSKGAYSLNPIRTGPYSKLPQPNTTYATGQPGNIPDPRFPDDLGNGPFQLSRYMAYSDFPGDPVHRFFQMWQQVGDNNRKDLFVWVAETVGIGNHNSPPTSPDNTDQGGLAMGFFNMNTGDAPFFKQMADLYAISDNYHQPIMGGTGANFIGLVTGDAAFYNVDGVPATPPTNFLWQGVTTSQVENPDPQPAGSNTNWYTEDGYRGGSYVNCSDMTQPGITADYCGICDPLTGFTSIMTTSLKQNLKDVNDLYADITAGTVPSVAFVRPLEQLAGHPANAVLALYENFVTNLVNMVHDQSDLWNTTAILITYDEGGGYYDSGYIQPVDFFGDGTRIPLIAISPYAKKGFVDHTYYDHVSVLKFIERNWGLNPLSARSRDNLPNPVQPPGTYVPTNGPAIGDLGNLFNFSRFRPNAPAITPIITDQGND